MTDDSTLFDAVDGAAQQLAGVVSSLESTGNAALYRSALEAHAATTMLRAQLRAYVRWAREAEQAHSMASGGHERSTHGSRGVREDRGLRAGGSPG